jgi:hypothetical protein
MVTPVGPFFNKILYFTISLPNNKERKVSVVGSSNTFLDQFTLASIEITAPATTKLKKTGSSVGEYVVVRSSLVATA